MHYTYMLDIQGNDRSSRYLKFTFDQNITPRNLYREIHAAHLTPLEARILNGVADVCGVIKGNGSSSSPELINLTGNTLVVRISEIEPKQITALAQRIVKRVHRAIAPKESRKRVSLKKIQSYADRLARRNKQ